MNPGGLSLDQEAALSVAGGLISAGIPVFAAPPVIGQDGQWDLEAGCHGYRLPSGWQNIEPDVGWLDHTAAGFANKAWRPGWALAAVMGRGLDLLDIDPRSGGDASRAQLVTDGNWPRARGVASTPSGGWHEFVTSLGVGSRDAVMVGLDVKGGLPAGNSRGFAFIAPTAKRSKVTGTVMPYAWITTPDLRRLHEPDSSVEAIRELVRQARGTSGLQRSQGLNRPLRPHAHVPGRPHPPVATLLASESTEAWLHRLPGGEPCDCVRLARDRVLALVEQPGRHEAILGPMVALARLGQQRHRGVPDAVSAIRGSFLARMQDSDRAEQAAAELERALAGAVHEVSGAGRLVEHPACKCVLTGLQQLLQQEALFSTGVASNNERKVLRYLLQRARQHGSLLVQESQRQISEAVDVHQPTVVKVLKRLRQLGWLQVLPRRGPAGAAGYLLQVPAAVETLSTKDSLRAEQLVDNFSALVHPIFGAGGLGPGPERTFAALAERHQRGRGGALVNVRRGTSRSRDEPRADGRRVPRPAKPRRGRTPAEIAAATGRTPGTVRVHLRRLEQVGLAFTVNGVWYRNAFHPEAVLRELGYEDTATRKRYQYYYQRMQYFDFLCQYSDSREAVAVRTQDGDTVLYHNRRTGELLWSHLSPEPAVAAQEGGTRCSPDNPHAAAG